MYDFESQIVDIPDYPEPGVIFKDITPLFGNPEALKAMTDALAEHFAGMGITKVVGPEARGFMVGVPVAVALGTGFVPARKPGKLEGCRSSAACHVFMRVCCAHVASFPVTKGNG